MRYRLTEEAADDLDRLYDFGIGLFGQRVADRYYDDLIAIMESLPRQPTFYPQVDHIKPGYRRAVHKSHSIYYQTHADEILIVRILGRENPFDQLPD